MAELIKIDGWTVSPRPSNINPSWQPIVDGDRNANGDFIGDLVNTKAKLELTWNVLSAADWATISSTLTGFFVSITYINMLTNTTRTATFYTSPLTASVERYNASTGAIEYYENIRLALVEK